MTDGPRDGLIDAFNNNLLYYVASVLDPHIEPSLIVSRMSGLDLEFVVPRVRKFLEHHTLQSHSPRVKLTIHVHREFQNNRRLGLRLYTS